MKYRKRPAEVEAMQFVITSKALAELSNFMLGQDLNIECVNDTLHLKINTSDGIIKANEGDFIVKDTDGEFNTYKPDVFKATYEIVNGFYSSPTECYSPYGVKTTLLKEDTMLTGTETDVHEKNVGQYALQDNGQPLKIPRDKISKMLINPSESDKQLYNININDLLKIINSIFNTNLDGKG